MHRGPRGEKRPANVIGAAVMALGVFMTERDGPMTPKAFHALFRRIGAGAKMPFPVHPHMLRHGCGYALANAGHDTKALQAWLGHKNIQHTVRYTELSPHRFKDYWR
jgi:site-specific recombinase XerD